MRQREPVFVDSGAWIALALTRDPLHERARSQWDEMQVAAAKLHTSIPVVIETFTFLERNTHLDIALQWKETVYQRGAVVILPCEARDMTDAWRYFQRKDRHKLSAVDATSFAIMQRARICVAFSFDHHFAVAGFGLAG